LEPEPGKNLISNWMIWGKGRQKTRNELTHNFQFKSKTYDFDLCSSCDMLLDQFQNCRSQASSPSSSTMEWIEKLESETTQENQLYASIPFIQNSNRSK